MYNYAAICSGNVLLTLLLFLGYSPIISAASNATMPTLSCEKNPKIYKQ